MDTSKKVVIVTGASRGLGEVIARQAAKMGGSLVLNARSADKLEAVAEELRKMGADVVAVPGDVTDPSTADKIIAQALGHYGKIDSLVNNSGIIEPIAPLSKADPEAWRANLEVNLLSVVMLTQRAIPHLRETNGTIISISSGAATRVIPGWGAYSLAKAGINHFTAFLAVEEPAITSLAIRPGVVDTSMQKEIRELGGAGMPESEHDKFVQLHEQGKLLAPELPGRAVACLALHARHEWSGQFMPWNDKRIGNLLEE